MTKTDAPGAQQGQPQAEHDADIDDDWRAQLEAIRSDIAREFTDRGDDFSPEEHPWQILEAMLPEALALAAAKKGAHAPEDLRSVTLPMMLLLTRWDAMLREGDLPNRHANGGRWPGYELLRKWTISEASTVQIALQYLEDLGIVQLKRNRQISERWGSKARKTGQRLAGRGPIREISVCWSKFGGYPGRRASEVRAELLDHMLNFREP